MFHIRCQHVELNCCQFRLLPKTRWACSESIAKKRSSTVMTLVSHSSIEIIPPSMTADQYSLNQQKYSVTSASWCYGGCSTITTCTYSEVGLNNGHRTTSTESYHKYGIVPKAGNRTKSRNHTIYYIINSTKAGLVQKSRNSTKSRNLLKSRNSTKLSLFCAFCNKIMYVGIHNWISKIVSLALSALT